MTHIEKKLMKTKQNEHEPSPRIVSAPTNMNIKLSIALVVVVGSCFLSTTKSAPVPSLFNCLMDCTDQLADCARKCSDNGIEYSNSLVWCVSFCSKWKEGCERSCVAAQTYHS